MTRDVPLPWWVAALALLPLGALVTHTARDLRAQRLTAASQRAQDHFDFDAALNLARRATTVNGGDAPAWLARAQRARTLWLYRDTPALQREADGAFNTAARLSPHWATPAYEHARMYGYKLRHAQAVAWLRAALRLDPNNAGYWLELGRELEAARQPEAALNAYARCWATDEVSECRWAHDRLAGTP